MPDSLHPSQPHPVLRWVAALFGIAAFFMTWVGTLIWSLSSFTATFNASQTGFQKSVDGLTTQVHELATQTGNLASSYAGVSEHLRSVDGNLDKLDRRLERVEKDRTVEHYKRD